MDEERLEAKLREREKKIKMLENAIEDVKAVSWTSCLNKLKM